MPSPSITAKRSAGKGRSNPILKLAESARRNELVAIIGTGVSVGLANAKIPTLSWKGLIRDGFQYAQKKGKISADQIATWQPQLDSSDLDEVLGAAEFMARKLDAPEGDLYSRWFESTFKDLRPANKRMEQAIRGLRAADIPLCTLNYDTLLEAVTGLPSVNTAESVKLAEWMRREYPSILHLHGSWDVPISCILGIRDYQTTLGNEVRDLIQRSLGAFRRLLFIGCGDTFADPNFSALIKWLRNNLKTAAPEHFALVTDAEVALRHKDPTWLGFVEPLSYGSDHSDLPNFLLELFPAHAGKSRSKATLTKTGTAVSKHARLLRDYRAFLLKDCGEMTIEGVRADLDTAQRRFDLERLFVPLEVVRCPPEFPLSDPQRDEKLRKWQEKHKEPITFGKLLGRTRHIALLALPGGGKSLLLKRLAVAYADPSRRRASSDALPDLDLLPVLIRCREWRELIHRPIQAILNNLADFTGHAALDGLSEALSPLFREGRTLLLVDGLDEIHDDALRATFVEHLEAFIAENKLTRLVVTSREAGFSLVAPSLSRFCERWRVAPLSSGAINTLCGHWHLLMTGHTPGAREEGRQIAEFLITNESLRRLAENPLLLTMLLVVKHGAGRLPPDRVSLYGRAVEVLLDTWNIKGHEPLNLKEAVPQLAFVAFQLMRAGKQTATERELLELLEQAREGVPQIRRYAKDNPQEFLKRVELRSSLVVEVGRQADGSSTVPFYQFRHLTFQEYLAAVAAVEGHYLGYQQNDTVLTPLQSNITSEEWKEVIPMSAVLARKQAQPLIKTLVALGNDLRKKTEADESHGKIQTSDPSRIPPPVARLVQCLIEEAEAAPDTIAAALKLVVFFAKGCRSTEDWRALARGPYGNELIHQGWLYHSSMTWPNATLIRSTCAALAFLRRQESYWESAEGRAEVKDLLRSGDAEAVWRGLFTWAGLCNGRERPRSNRRGQETLLLADIEETLSHDDPGVLDAALWTWGYIHFLNPGRVKPRPAILDRLLTLWLGAIAQSQPRSAASVALGTKIGLPRRAWTPVLTESQAQAIRQQINNSSSFAKESALRAGSMVAFHAGNVLAEAELVERIVGIAKNDLAGRPERDILHMLKEMGETGRKALKSLQQLSENRTRTGTDA
uniref:Putative signal transduction protein with Nacht domain n=1 Tax=Solibacter usitatus (strain Ellin6076) TaxID=234267 RepID=Q01YL7_SOLUE